MLDALSWSPVGAVPDALRAVRPDDAETPVRRLLAYGLLVAVDSETVVLPREVGLALRGGKLFPPGALHRPRLERTTERAGGARLVERTAAGQAFSAVRAIVDLLDAWSVEPPSTLKAGGLGVRELRRWARDLDLDEPVLATYLEAAYAAGLLAASTELEPAWLPTPSYDTWRRLPPERQWVALVEAWLATTRLAGLVGSKDDRDRTLSVLSADIERSAAPDLRRTALAALAELPKGAAATAESVVALVSWLVPRRAPARSAEQVGWALAEAASLGVTGVGALSAAGRALLAGDVAGAASALEPLLPEPVDHVLLQADLTAVAPGPLVTDLAHELSLLADVESKGGATVYRFTEGSVRRAARLRTHHVGGACPAGSALPHPGAAGADLPGRRRGASPWPHPRRHRRRLHPQRRPRRAGRDPGVEEGHPARAPAAGADGAGLAGPGRPGARGAPRTGSGAGGRVSRRRRGDQATRRAAHDPAAATAASRRARCATGRAGGRCGDRAAGR